jgi:hypothetical protein
LSLKTKVGGLSVIWPQNYWTIFFDLTSKPVAMVFSDLATKSVATISPGLALKPVVDFLVEPQNQDGEGFPVLCLKTDSCSLMIWVSKSLR